jgi:hypothetical protein
LSLATGNAQNGWFFVLMTFSLEQPAPPSKLLNVAQCVKGRRAWILAEVAATVANDGDCLFDCHCLQLHYLLVWSKLVCLASLKTVIPNPLVRDAINRVSIFQPGKDIFRLLCVELSAAFDVLR